VTTGVDFISVFAFLVYLTRPTGNSLTQTQLKSLSAASDGEVEIQVNNQFSSASASMAEHAFSLSIRLLENWTSAHTTTAIINAWLIHCVCFGQQHYMNTNCAPMARTQKFTI
jgi:hypothetical protein